MTLFARYKGPAYAIVRCWHKHDVLPDVVPPWPAIEVHGLLAEFTPDTPDSTPQAGYVEVAGDVGRLACVLERTSPGWAVHFPARVRTDSFVTVYDAMAYAVGRLVSDPPFSAETGTKPQ